MKCIIVIKGVAKRDYEEIRQDLISQMESKGMPIPLFASLPADYVEIEVVWLDEDMEKAMFSETLESIKNESRPYFRPTN
jgi:hypothetical protein